MHVFQTDEFICNVYISEFGGSSSSIGILLFSLRDFPVSLTSSRKVYVLQQSMIVCSTSLPIVDHYLPTIRRKPRIKVWDSGYEIQNHSLGVQICDRGIKMDM
jgi:hypothetical protein